jgi:hypothetical protein
MSICGSIRLRYTLYKLIAFAHSFACLVLGPNTNANLHVRDGDTAEEYTGGNAEIWGPAFT